MTLATALAATVDPVPAAAQQGLTTIEVLSVSPWVAPDGTWTARLRIDGAPTGAQLAYSIRQPPTGTEAEVRAALIAVRGGDDTTKLMRSAVVADLASLTDASGTTTVTIPIRSGSSPRERVKIPNRGAYPVVVTVTDPQGDTTARASLSLNRLPDDERSPFGVGLVVDAPSVDAFDAEGRPAVTPALRNNVTSLIERIEAAGSAPIRVGLRAESLVALDSSGTDEDRALIDRLRDATAHATIMGTGWGDPDAEAWASADALTEMQTSVVDGQEATFIRLQRPVDTRLWPVDATVGPAAVELLTQLGVSAALFDPDRLQGPRGPTGETGFTRPFRVEGDGSATVVGLAVDPELGELLESGEQRAPAAVHEVITQLFATWVNDTLPRGAVLRLGPATDPSVVRELVDTLSSSSDTAPAPLTIVDPVAVTELPLVTVGSGARGTPWTRTVTTPEAAAAVNGIAARLRTARPFIDDYAAIMPTGDPVAARYAVVAQRSLDRGEDVESTERGLDETVEAIEADLDRITAAAPRAIWVTSRVASIPLRFTNDTGRPARVRLRLQSPRLIFTGGALQELTLQPGVNRIPVEVDVRASGQFLMQADLLAPDSDRVLASTRQRIRSRAFSGVGLMLSGGALVFLVIWWTRTLRKRSRAAADATAGDPESDTPPQ